ncbi:MAG: cation:proton antiporter, partial [Chitinophagaceae bacterium]|nr:cation:proton antiporter [Chitinophagaceae bacterium]
RVQHNNTVTISFMLLMPFVTYRLAEELNVSGVIAVVILGLAIARFSNKILPEQMKAQSKNIWEIIIFLLNGLIFILIGLEFPYIARSIKHEHILPYTLYALAITMAALLLRFFRVYMQQVNLERAYKKGHPRVTVNSLYDFKNSLIISWSGMRGIVSLAIAIGLPKHLQDGTPFPMRNAIVFISVAVVLFTLVGQGLTLPWLIRRLRG